MNESGRNLHGDGEEEEGKGFDQYLTQDSVDDDQLPRYKCDAMMDDCVNSIVEPTPNVYCCECGDSVHDLEGCSVRQSCGLYECVSCHKMKKTNSDGLPIEKDGSLKRIRKKLVAKKSCSGSKRKDALEKKKSTKKKKMKLYSLGRQMFIDDEAEEVLGDDEDYSETESNGASVLSETVENVEEEASVDEEVCEKEKKKQFNEKKSK